MTGVRGKASYGLISLAVVLLDQISKGLVEKGLPLFGRHEIIPGFFNLVHVRNRGVAFGLFSSQGHALWGVLLLSALGVAALLVVGLYFWRTPPSERLLLASLALIMGGAVGNLIDRIGSGAVTDFLDVYYRSYHWHTFNLADSAITVGIVLMLLDFLRPATPQPDVVPGDEAPAHAGAGAPVPGDEGSRR